MSSIKKAGKKIEEIIIDDENLKFYFQNKMKDPLLISKSQISITIIDDRAVDIINNSIMPKEPIGRIDKSDLENINDWEGLLAVFVRTN